MEALQVHRHRTLREEDRHHRPGPDRRPRRRPPAGLRHQDPRLRPLHHLGPRRPARRAAGDPGRAAGAVRLHHHPHAQDAGDRRHARRRVLQEDEEHRVRRQRRPRRPRRRGSPATRRWRPARSPAPASTSSSSEPSTDLPFFEMRQRRGHPAPRRVHGRGPGEGRRLGGQVRPPGAGRRAGSRRRQRRRRRHRPGRPPGHPAGRKAGPHLHRADARLAHPVRRRGCRRNRLARRQGARTRRAQGHLRRRRDRAGLLRQRPRDRRAARHQRPPDHRRRTPSRTATS